MTTVVADHIERQIVLEAPRSKVWRALTDAQEFGKWFQAEFEGGFVPGAPVRGRITYPGYENVTFEVYVERMESERLFSFRWHPFAVDLTQDYSKEPTTRVVFELEDVPEGTRLTLTESGFDQIPLERREEAYRRNSGGWDEQVKNIARHVALAP